MRPRAFLILLLWGAGLLRAFAGVPLNDGWRTLLLPRTELPAAANALVRWRPDFPRLFPDVTQISDQLSDESSPLAPLPAKSTALDLWLNSLRPTLARLRLQPGESLQPLPLRGPETPFPDHQPLNQLALVRFALLRAVWRDQRPEEALVLALDNLALARALLATQEGIVPALNATGVWETALDGAYWLARQPELTPAQASLLQADLSRDSALAMLALERAFRGEFTFFTRLVADRLPRTHDPELLLSGIGSLGMAPPEVPEPGEFRLGISARNPFDREATLQAAADDVRGWINALARTGRHPRTLATTHTGARLQSYASEIPALLRYASSELPPTSRQIAAADTEIATVDNPVGKLFLIITTTQWAPVSVHVFKREAQRRALIGLLAWCRFGRPATWNELIAAGLLASAPADPFTHAEMRSNTSNRPRLWSAGVNGTDEGGGGDGDNSGRPDDLTWPSR